MKNKEKFMSDTAWGITSGFVILVILYGFKYNSLSSGWRFFGMTVISLVIGLAIQFLLIIIDNWRAARINKKRAADMCRGLGVPTDSTNPDDIARCWKYMIDRYSTELLSNRLSDVIGTIITVARTVLSVMITLWYFGMIAFFVWYQDFGEPTLLWFPLISQLILSVCTYFISSITNIIFNRLPGEARIFNKKYDAMRETDTLLSNQDFR